MLATLQYFGYSTVMGRASRSEYVPSKSFSPDSWCRAGTPPQFCSSPVHMVPCFELLYSGEMERTLFLVQPRLSGVRSHKGDFNTLQRCLVASLYLHGAQWNRMGQPSVVVPFLYLSHIISVPQTLLFLLTSRCRE